MKILVSGGHLTPALAFIDYVTKHSKKDSFVFVGRIYSRVKTKQKAREKTEVEKRNIPFVAFDSGKLGQGSVFLLPLTLLQIIGAFFKAIHIFLRFKPDVYLSFGSYISVPLALAAWLLRIKIVVHEQTRTLGIANTFASRFASVVALSYPETSKLISHPHVTVTGNPVRTSILQKNITAPTWYKTKSKDPILYIAGGSQGSEIINTTVKQSLALLTKEWVVIHQCGAKTTVRNYKKELEKKQKQLSLRTQSKYFVREWVNETELAWIYTTATGAISRAGANTVLELSLRYIPTIYIPLPFSHQNEQYLNAKCLAESKQAFLIQQKDLSPEKLLSLLDELKRKHGQIKRTLTQEQASVARGSEKLYKAVIALKTTQKKK